VLLLVGQALYPGDVVALEVAEDERRASRGDLQVRALYRSALLLQ
jgi:hypothetical protein